MRLLILVSFLLAGCANTQYFTLTGHGQQAAVIQASLQQALEHNPDGASTHSVSYTHLTLQTKRIV